MSNSFKELESKLSPGIKKITSNEEVEEAAIKLGDLKDELKKHPDEKDRIMKEIQKINEAILSYDKFANYAYKCVLDNYPTYAVTAKDDMMSYVWMELFAHIHQYRTSLGDITTFCKPHIKHGCALYTSQLNKKSRYYNEVYTKIAQVEKEYMAEGYDESEITDDMIFDKLPDLTCKRISEARKRNELSKQSSLDPSYEAPSFNTPEKELMEREKTSQLYEILDSLQPYQKTLLQEAASGNKKWIDDLGHNQEFISMIKKAGYSHFISKSSSGEISIKPLKIKLLYQEAINEARYFSGKKPEAKPGKGSFIDFNVSMKSTQEIDDMLMTL